jgi:hypothetical protein
MIIEVNGQQVEVDDSFAKLSADQQQAELAHITQAITPKSSVEVRGATEADLINPLTSTIGGAIIGEVAGPIINKGVEAMRKGAPAASAALNVPGSAGGAAPGQKFAAKTGYGSGPGYTVQEVVEHQKAQAKPIGSGKISGKIAGNTPMNIDKMMQLEAAQKAEAARRAAALAPTGMMAKLPEPVQAAGRFVGGATQSGVAPWLGRGLAGAGVGFQGADAYNRFQQGDYPGAAISGLGALGSAASFIPTPVTRLGGAAIGVGAEALNMYLDSLKQKVEQQPAPAPAQAPMPQMAAGGLAGYDIGGKVKLAKKMSGGLDLGNILPSAAFKAAPEQTVTNPLRNEYPGVYKRPDVIAKEAAARVAPEDPMLKRLFGVTRDDLFEMSKRQGNEPGFIPGASKNPKGSAAAEAVMNPRNTQRLIDVLGEVKTNAPDLYRGMHAWYTMDPQYHRMVELMGEEKAKQMYHRLNTFGGIESPNLPVPVEFNRASAANWLAEQGRMPDWIKYGGLRDKHLVEGMPSDIIGVPGRVGHQRASESQRKFLETGEHGMISPKAPPYIQASSVPELGFQTDLPVGDAHWSRFIGLPDVRTSKEVSASVSTPELQQLAPWWKNDVAGASGLESVPAQAIVWGAGSPQTGVKTAIGAGKLELQAIQMAEAAKRLGISPETARDMILMGEQRAGKKQGGLV